jgi:hypothetical protein
MTAYDRSHPTANTKLNTVGTVHYTFLILSFPLIVPLLGFSLAATPVR